MTAWTDFDYAILRWVPCVHRGEFVNIGLVLHAPTAQYLRLQFRTDLENWCDDGSRERVRRYLDSLSAIAAGDRMAGPLGELSRSERFHWLTAPRSDCLQASPRHAGRANDLDEVFERIYRREVAAAW